jgi:hypothetical protein
MIEKEQSETTMENERKPNKEVVVDHIRTA